MRILLVFYSGLRGRGFKAPRIRAVMAALKERGFYPVLYGIPDTWATVRSLGISVAVRLWISFLVEQKLGGGRNRFRKTIEKVTIKRLEQGNVKLLIYTQDVGFSGLIKRCSILKVPTIVECSSSSIAKGNRSTIAALQLANRIVVFSDEDRRALIQEGIPADRVRCIWPVNSSVYRLRLPPPCPEVPRFIYTSFFNKKRKRLNMVLRAWTNRSSPDGELHIVGPIGAEFSRTRSFYNARRDVVFWGFSDPHDLYLRIQGVGLQVSEREGLPRAMLEYMEYGFPLLVSAEASKGLVKDGVAGKVLDPCDEEALRKAFDSIITNYSAFWELGRAGQSQLHELIRKGEYGSRVADLVNELMLGTLGSV